MGEEDVYFCVLNIKGFENCILFSVNNNTLIPRIPFCKPQYVNNISLLNKGGEVESALIFNNEEDLIEAIVDILFFVYKFFKIRSLPIRRI